MSKPRKGKPRGRNGGRPVTTGTLRPAPVSFRLTVEAQADLLELAQADGVNVHAAAKALTLAGLAVRKGRP